MTSQSKLSWRYANDTTSIFPLTGDASRGRWLVGSVSTIPERIAHVRLLYALPVGQTAENTAHIRRRRGGRCGRCKQHRNITKHVSTTIATTKQQLCKFITIWLVTMAISKLKSSLKAPNDHDVSNTAKAIYAWLRLIYTEWKRTWEWIILSLLPLNMYRHIKFSKEPMWIGCQFNLRFCLMQINPKMLWVQFNSV